ncbi:MAG: sulfite exporter TauE/SafE family protein [Chloroflexi bacterium]|nr:MAG: sulfite exporter TauE/SafE family protein [Chloroflexota bacterium]
MNVADYSFLFWVTAVTAVLLLGVSKAGFGTGAGLVATPLLALTIPVTDAAAILLPLLILMDALSIRYYYRSFDRDSIRVMLPGALVGIVLGSVFFGYLSDNERILEVGIGVLALLFVVYQTIQVLFSTSLERLKMPNTAGVLLGSVAGFSSTVAHAGGPPSVIYLLPQHFSREIFVGTTVVFFTIVNLIKLVPYGMLGLLSVGNLTIVVILAPLCLLGVRLGIFANRHFNDVWFTRIVYALLFLTGIQLIVGHNLLDFVF